MLATALAASTLVPNFLHADQPQPTLFQNSIAAQARPLQQNTEPKDAQWAEVRKRKVGTSSGSLRWQSPTARSHIKPAAHTSAVVDKPKVAANKIVTWGQDAAKKTTGQIRLVNQLGPIDPFDDPFGDRETQFNEPASRAFVSQPNAEALPPADGNEFKPFGPASDQDAVPQMDERLPNNSDDSEALDLFNELAPAQPQAEGFRDDVAPEPPAVEDERFRDPIIPQRQPYQPAGNCDSIYNERDCCADGEQCRNARHRVRQNTIDRISLNISPLFKPDATTDAEAERARTLRLAQSAIRSWHNRDGEVIARGQVTDLKFGRIQIEHAGKVESIPVRELSDDDWCFLAAWWGVPTECSLGDDKFEQREWLASTMTWKASGACHKPLYFEEVQLERYGHTVGPVLQPAISGAHFFLNIATLPYQMGISPPNECEYALGYYRPGSCAPWLLPPIPLSVRGALMEAGAITGGVFMIP